MNKAKQVLIGLLALASFAVYMPSTETDVVNATNPVGLKPILTCADVNGDGPVAGGDFFAVLGRFGTTYPNSNFSYLYDLNTPPDGAVAGGDFFVVLGDFGLNCPATDTEVAQATLGILTHPQAANIMACNEATLESLGYYQGSSDVPGQGIHYVNIAPTVWDGDFNVAQPEGLVCKGNPLRLAAELYVVRGDVIGWGTWDGSGAIHSKDIDTFTNCTPAPCSWDTSEGWHAHANLCTIHMGASNSVAFPTSSPACTAAAGGEPVCTAPVTTTPCYTWDDRVGWMGHLWNFQLNPNLVDENGDTTADHGRFADCAPPQKAEENCPM